MGSSPPSPHHPWGDLIMKGLWDLGAARDLLRYSTSSILFRCNRNSCFEITSVVLHFSSPFSSPFSSERFLKTFIY